jgi:hypothetical protein
MDFFQTIMLVAIGLPVLLLLFVFGVIMLFTIPILQVAKKIRNPSITIRHETVTEKEEKSSSS